MALMETILDSILHLEIAGVSLDTLITVGVILGLGYGAVTFGKTIMQKIKIK